MSNTVSTKKVAKKKKTPEQKRVERAHRDYLKARRELDEFVSENEEVVTRLSELADNVNMKLKRFEASGREYRVGAGTTTIIVQRSPVFNIDAIEDIFEDDPEVLSTLVTISKKVNRKVYDKLLSDGRIKPKDVKNIIAGEKEKVVVRGLPSQIIMP